MQLRTSADGVRRIVRTLTALLFAATLLAPNSSLAHPDRTDVGFPSGNGVIPTHRTDGPLFVVCKDDSASRIAELAEPFRSRGEALLDQCEFEHIQAAVNAVTEPGSRIQILPGVYKEEPTIPVSAECTSPVSGNMTYDWMYRCPNTVNLIAIMGDDPADTDRECTNEPRCRLQIEGMGAGPLDVVIDAQFKKLNGIRADRADGVYMTNFTAQHAPFSAAFVMESDGWVMDRMIARWDDEYGFNTFVADHGVISNCEAYGNGDSGTYIGADPDVHGARASVELKNCDVHHNALGYSGTSGNSTYVHHNDFRDNGVGIATDSFYPEHPGSPEDSATFSHNRIYSNNVDYYRYEHDGEPDPNDPTRTINNTCDKPSAERGYDDGVVCPVVPVPVGTGLLIAGGNANMVAYNQIYDNWRYGTMQFWVPAVLRNETDPTKLYDTSHFNRYLYNRMGIRPDGTAARNGTDFWWDEEGSGNCWEGNTSDAGAVRSEPPSLPACAGTPLFLPGNPVKQGLLVPCAAYLAPPCDWFQTPPKP